VFLGDLALEQEVLHLQALLAQGVLTTCLISSWMIGFMM